MEWQISKKTLFVALALLIVCISAACDGASREASDAKGSARSFKLPKLFDFGNFKRLFKKSYASLSEELARKKLFLGRAFKVFVSAVSYRYRKSSYYLSINKMSDWTGDELRQTHVRLTDSPPIRHDESSLKRRQPDKSERTGVNFVAEVDTPPVAQLEEIEASLAEVVEQKDKVPGYRQAAELLSELAADETMGARRRRRRDTTGDDHSRASLSASDLIESPLELSGGVSEIPPSDNPDYEPPKLKLRVQAGGAGIQRMSRPVRESIERLPAGWESLRSLTEVFSDDKPEYGGGGNYAGDHYGAGGDHYGAGGDYYGGDSYGDDQYGGSRNGDEEAHHSIYGSAFDKAYGSMMYGSSSTSTSDGGQDSSYGYGYDEAGTSNHHDDDEQPDEPPPREETQNYESSDDDELFIDHRGCIQAPRDQGSSCGSCYVFAAIALYEWYYCKKSNQRVALSEQYVVDCGDSIEGLDGCTGGWPRHVSDFVAQYGLELQSNYPYLGYKGECPYEQGSSKMGYLRPYDSGMVDVDLDDAERHLRKRPLVAVIYIHDDFQFYGGGIYEPSFQHHGARDDRHVLLLVGSGRQGGKDYWLLRNSQGSGWGESGYMKLSKAAGHIFEESHGLARLTDFRAHRNLARGIFDKIKNG